MKLNTLPKFVPSSSKVSQNYEVKKRFYNLLCPIFVKHFNPYLNIIKGSCQYQLFRDIEQNLYCIEEMIQSGQLDEFCQLILSEASKVRMLCTSNLQKDPKHKRSKKIFNYEFDENEWLSCQKCKQLCKALCFISVKNYRLAKRCYKCRDQARPTLYRKRCSKCM
jgi:hypothetical protein